MLHYRHLSEEIRLEHSARVTAGTPVDDLFQLATQIVPYFMSHNAETDACDLLMEIERLDILYDVVESTTYQRVCLYLTRYILLNCFTCNNFCCTCNTNKLIPYKL